MAAFTAYIDESGCDGFAFDRGSSDFLVIGAVLCRTATLCRYQQAVDDARVALRKDPAWRFKSFKDLGSVSQKWAIVDRLSASPGRCVAVAIYKPALVAEGWADNPGDLYFQASKFLVERISWACRDAPGPAEDDPRVRIVFSERKGLRYEAFRDYLRRLRADPVRYQTRAEWAHLDPDLVDHAVHDDGEAPLLAADYFAASLGLALERKDQGVFDDRFARLWARKLYRPNGRAVGNGLKVWPDDGLTFLRTDARGDWMKLALSWA
jgi:hypothetical protein